MKAGGRVSESRESRDKSRVSISHIAPGMSRVTDTCVCVWVCECVCVCQAKRIWRLIMAAFVGCGRDGGEKGMEILHTRIAHTTRWPTSGLAY